MTFNWIDDEDPFWCCDQPSSGISLRPSLVSPWSLLILFVLLRTKCFPFALFKPGLPSNLCVLTSAGLNGLTLNSGGYGFRFPFFERRWRVLCCSRSECCMWCAWCMWCTWHSLHTLHSIAVCDVLRYAGFQHANLQHAGLQHRSCKSGLHRGLTLVTLWT